METAENMVLILRNRTQFFNLMHYSEWVKEPKLKMGCSTVETKHKYKRLFKAKDALYKKL